MDIRGKWSECQNKVKNRNEIGKLDMDNDVVLKKRVWMNLRLYGAQTHME